MKALAANIEADRDFLLKVFCLRAWARAVLVEAALMDFHEAIDVLQADAERAGLIDEIGIDRWQRILAAEFGGTPT